MTMVDKPINETARQRASRMWRNNYIQLHTLAELEAPIDEVIEEDKKLNAVRSRLSKVIRSILSNKNDKAINYYVVALRERRRRLLKEKLRRLRSNEHG